MKESTKLDSLTVFRFVAAASVVIFHYGRDTAVYKALPAVLAAGSIAVTFFFVLSGFVISISAHGRKFDLFRFYVNRVARIFPVYILALLAVLFAVNLDGKGLDFFLSLTMMQSWFSPYPLTLNMPGWSVSVEVFFYIVAPAMIVLAGRWGARSWLGWASISIIVWLVTQFVLSWVNKSQFHKDNFSFANDLVNYFPVSHFCSFLLGFTAGIAYKNGVLVNGITEREKRLIFILSVCLVVLLSKNGRRLNDFFGESFAYGSSFYSVVFSFFIYSCALSDKFISKAISVPALVLLGEASYSLYIMQMPIYMYFDMVFPKTLSWGGEYRFWLYFTILLAVSIALFVYVERPLSLLVKRKISVGMRRPVIPI